MKVKIKNGILFILVEDSSSELLQIMIGAPDGNRFKELEEMMTLLKKDYAKGD